MDCGSCMYQCTDDDYDGSYCHKYHSILEPFRADYSRGTVKGYVGRKPHLPRKPNSKISQKEAIKYALDDLELTRLSFY